MDETEHLVALVGLVYLYNQRDFFTHGISYNPNGWDPPTVKSPERSHLCDLVRSLRQRTAPQDEAQLLANEYGPDKVLGEFARDGTLLMAHRNGLVCPGRDFRDSVHRVVFASEGEMDESAWFMIAEMRDGTWICFEASCGMGWNHLTNMHVFVGQTLRDLILHGIPDEVQQELIIRSNHLVRKHLAACKLQRAVRRWRRVRAGQLIARKVLKWACRPGGVLARSACRDFEDVLSESHAFHPSLRRESASYSSERT